MKTAIHPNFKKAVWLYALKSLVVILINLLARPLTHPLAFIAIVLVDIIITFLIAYGYEWMKWFLLATVIIGFRQYIRYIYILYFTNELLIVSNSIIIRQVFSTIVDVIITVLLFKAVKRNWLQSESFFY